MTTYYPEAWSIIKIETKDKTSWKVFGSWRGGYLGSDSWKLNSGVKKVRFNGVEYVFEGHSGSEYICLPSLEDDHSFYNRSILETMIGSRAVDKIKATIISFENSGLEVGVIYD